MIEEYFRPTSVEEAVALLSDKKRVLIPFGGGTHISRHQDSDFGVVDLQAAGLDHIKTQDQKFHAGAMVRLNMLMDYPEVHPELKAAISIDASANIRNMATLGGWLVTSDGRSITTTILLAVDADLIWQPGDKKVSIGNWLPLREVESPGVLMIGIEWSLRPHLAVEYVSRSPKDKPVLIVAAAQWRSGRTRVVLGGYGTMPLVAMDGPDELGADAASRNAYAEANDAWASADYRREVAGKLALRCLERIKANKGKGGV